MHIDMDEGQRNWQFIIIKLIFRNRPSMVSTSLRKVTSSVKPFQIRICVRVSGAGGKYQENVYIQTEIERDSLTDYVKLVNATMETDEFKVYSEKLETRRDDGVVLAWKPPGLNQCLRQSQKAGEKISVPAQSCQRGGILPYLGEGPPFCSFLAFS